MHRSVASRSMKPRDFCEINAAATQSYLEVCSEIADKRFSSRSNIQSNNNTKEIVKTPFKKKNIVISLDGIREYHYLKAIVSEVDVSVTLSVFQTTALLLRVLSQEKKFVQNPKSLWQEEYLPESNPPNPGKMHIVLTPEIGNSHQEVHEIMHKKAHETHPIQT
ncbi:hypothetical protein Leryth_022712 [Lithospermum erythrorhizon]|nr:hypothetical protein Leryth_022712 [Lithospermum erythrorhizon]